MKAEPKQSSVRGQLFAVLVLVLLSAGAIVFILSGNSRPPRKGVRRSAGSVQPVAPTVSLRSFCGRPVGRKDAKVQVQAFLPVTVGCQDAIGLYLVEQAKAMPAQLRVQVYDMKNPEARGRMDEFGVHCAAVVINGATRFDLGGEGGKLLLEGPMDLEDVYRALTRELEMAYGDRAAKPSVPPELGGD
ncbi:MAG: hypothetical protein GXP31_11210 [Kiritimatiellaeota bacterium]|nr:hypothetical protein [Kiritimatiellota bacterium]